MIMAKHHNIDGIKVDIIDEGFGKGGQAQMPIAFQDRGISAPPSFLLLKSNQYATQKL